MNFYCNECGWKGVESELACDTVECCMGPTEIEICPKCGSMDVVKVLVQPNVEKDQ